MLLYVLIGFNALIFAVLLFSFFKQLLTASLSQRIEAALLQLTTQQQNTEQQQRESLLISMNHLQQGLAERLNQGRQEQIQHTADLKEQLQQAFANHRARFEERQFEVLKILQDTLQKGVQENRQQVKEALNDYSK